MPFFRYVATDAAGRVVEGSVQANSAQEVASLLRARGLTVDRIGANDFAPTPASPGPVSRTAAAPAPRPLSVDTVESEPIKTRWGSDKKLTLIFQQLAQLLRAGIAPDRAFAEIASRTSSAYYSDSLAAVGRHARDGGRISDAIRRYPYLYPSHIAGLIRAGEEGGFLPEAMNEVAEQVQASYKFKRWFHWLGLMALSMLLGLVLFKAMFNGFEGAFNKAWKGYSQENGVQAFGGQFGQQVVRFLPWLLLGLVCLYLLRLAWQSLANRPLRHRLVLWVPTVGKRAKTEAFGYFGWALAMLSRGGAAPRTAWLAACEACPNLEVRRRLESAALRSDEGVKLSEMLYRSRQLPEEFGPMVQTGEMAGDVPSALMHLAQNEKNEFGIKDLQAKRRAGCWIGLLSVLGTGIVYYMFYGQNYQRMMDTVIEDIENPQ